MAAAEEKINDVKRRMDLMQFARNVGEDPAIIHRRILVRTGSGRGGPFL